MQGKYHLRMIFKQLLLVLKSVTSNQCNLFVPHQQIILNITAFILSLIGVDC